MWIRIIHVNQEVWEAEFREAVQRAAARHTGSPESIKFGEPEHGHPDLVIYLGSLEGAQDPSCANKLTDYLNHAVRVLPLLRDLSHYREYTPQPLHEINGVQWSTAGEIGELVLRQIGLTEADRRVFLSYRRRDSTPLAMQLYDELHRLCYSVFLDRFDLEAGSRVQPRIYEALQEMSFVLLLESSQVQSSKWVEEEIGYAMEYGLGLLALAAPDIPEPPPFIMIPEDKRERIRLRDFESDGRLKPEALGRVLLRIEREHADQLRARRERMISDIFEVLRDAGRPSRRLGPCSLIRSGPLRETIVRVCPRPPTPRDLFTLGEERRARMDVPEAWLVGTRGGYHEGKEVTEWLARSLARQVPWLDPSEVAYKARHNLD